MATTSVMVATKIMTGMWIYHIHGRTWWPHTYKENTHVCDILGHITAVHPTVLLCIPPGKVLRWYDKISSDVFGVTHDTLVISVRGQMVPIENKYNTIQDILDACIKSVAASPWVNDVHVTGLETVNALNGERVTLDADSKYTGYALYAQWTDTGVISDEVIYSATPVQQLQFIHESDLDYFKFAYKPYSRRKRGLTATKSSLLGTMCITFQQDDPFYSTLMADTTVHGDLCFRLHSATLYDGRRIVHKTRSKKLRIVSSLKSNKIVTKLNFNTALQYKSCVYRLYST